MLEGVDQQYSLETPSLRIEISRDHGKRIPVDAET